MGGGSKKKTCAAAGRVGRAGRPLLGCRGSSSLALCPCGKAGPVGATGWRGTHKKRASMQWAGEHTLCCFFVSTRGLAGATPHHSPTPWTPAAFRCALHAMSALAQHRQRPEWRRVRQCPGFRSLRVCTRPAPRPRPASHTASSALEASNHVRRFPRAPTRLVSTHQPYYLSPTHHRKSCAKSSATRRPACRCR